MSTTIQEDIEARLASAEPDVEVLVAEVVGGSMIRLFIDHPEGVSLALCERVTQPSPTSADEYALEVSSPGPGAPPQQARPLPPLPRRKARVARARSTTSARSFTASSSAPRTTR
jgi:ribosome maturation factor RimP